MKLNKGIIKNTTLNFRNYIKHALYFSNSSFIIPHSSFLSKTLLLGITFCLVACIKEPTVIQSSVYDCTTSIENTHPQSSTFNNFLQSKVAEGIPGISMLIESPEGIWAGAAGFADIPNQAPMQACNIGRVGSITKTFTATLILQLHEKGLLDLSDKVSTHLDPTMADKIDNAATATIAQLLDHTSGITDYAGTIDFSIEALNNTSKLWTAEEELKFIYGQPADFEPGAQRKYSNSGYVLLGLIAQNITGKTGAELFQEQIFTPLNLSNTFFYQDNTIPKNIARGYSDEEDNMVLIDRTEFSFAHSSMEGGAISNVEDLRTFLQAAMTPNELFSAATIERMLTVTTPAGEDHIKSDADYLLRIDGIGLGWFNIETPHGKAYGHGGSLRGYKSFMAYFPDSKTTFCYIMNGNDGQVKDLERQLLRYEIVPLLFE